MAISVSLAFSGCDLAAPDGPGAYRGLPVPEATLASPEARSEGRELFLLHCALCHGEAADGRGERRSALSTPPVNFAARAWRAQATPRGTYAAIRDGVRGTAMPAWRGLDEDEVWSLVAYLLSVSEKGP